MSKLTLRDNRLESIELIRGMVRMLSEKTQNDKKKKKTTSNSPTSQRITLVFELRT